MAYFPDFIVRHGLKKSMNGVHKQILTALFILGMVENYCTLPKNSTSAYYSLRATKACDLWDRIIIVYHSPHEQSIFVYMSHDDDAGSLIAWAYIYQFIGAIFPLLFQHNNGVSGS